MSPLTSSAGHRRHHLTIFRRSGTTSGTGGQTEGTPVRVGDGWFSIEPISMREREQLQGGGIQAETTHILRTDYRSTLTPAMYLILGNRRFEILSLANVDEKNRELELLCAERT